MAVGLGGETGAEVALGGRARIAFAYLLLERWRPVGRDELADAVWGPEPPATWADALRGVVRRVRTTLHTAGLDTEVVLTNGLGGYQVRLPPDAVIDVEVAAAAMERARAALAGDPRDVCAFARQAAMASRREFLAGLSGVWVEHRQAELRELHIEALELLSRGARACGDGATALRAAEEAVAMQPFRESSHLCLMAAHAAVGNRAEALRAYARCRHVLIEELGVGPSTETESAYVSLLEDQPDQGAGIRGAPAHNLPLAVTSFVGREIERVELKQLLASTRLVTLTGMGGLGKSRLGVEVAKDLLAHHPDGTWLVELSRSSIADPAFLAAHILSVVGSPDRAGSDPLELLIVHLARREMLVLFDNCDHVAGACAALCDALLRACPGLRVLATSREPLGVAGETVWAVPPLARPGSVEDGSSDDFARCESVRLFVDRARAASPRFELEPVIEGVAEICRRLDGIPLAVELAAARTRQLTVPEIADRLGDRFRLLVGGPRTNPERHQTLRRALDWSYDALSAPEKSAFERLSVFSGGFTLEAAEALCPDIDDVLEAVSGLVDKCLVVPDQTHEKTRFRLLETVRSYGLERLTVGGCEVEMRLTELQWAVELTESAELALAGPDQARWLEGLDSEQDNLRGVLDWAASNENGGRGLRIAASLWRYWEMRGLLDEGRSRLEAFLGAGPAPPQLRAKALTSAGILAQNHLDHDGARAFYQEALDIRQSIGDRLGVAAALNGLGNVAVGEGDLLAALELFEQNLSTSRDIGDPSMIAASLMNLGVVLQLMFVSGRTDWTKGSLQAHACYQESLLYYRQLGDRHGIALALENLGAVAPYRGDYPGAQVCLEESLTLRRQLCDRSGIAASARFLGHLAYRHGNYGEARRLHEEALAIESDLGNHLLMAADLASLADIAEKQDDGAKAEALRGRALVLGGNLDAAVRSRGER